MAKKAANRVIENTSEKRFELENHYLLTPDIINCNINQGFVESVLTFYYKVITDDGVIEKEDSITVDLDCKDVRKKEYRTSDAYITMKDGDDEETVPIIFKYYCIPTNKEVTYCINKESVKVFYETRSHHWEEGGKLSKDGGTVKVGFEYMEYVKDASGETSNVGVYEEFIEVPPCNCDEDPECGGTLTGEIEFKQAHEDGCNIIAYNVEQDTCPIL